MVVMFRELIMEIMTVAIFVIVIKVNVVSFVIVTIIDTTVIAMLRVYVKYVWK